MKRTPLLRKTPLQSKTGLQRKTPLQSKTALQNRKSLAAGKVWGNGYDEPRGESIMQSDKRCWLTGRTDDLQLHHIFPGRRRRASDKWGCWVWLHRDAHTGSGGVHNDLAKMRSLQEECRARFVELYGEAKFVEVFGH